jgi:hypothetical protein
MRAPMSDLDALRRVAIAGAIMALVISVPASLAFFAAFGWNIEASIVGDPSAILGSGSAAALLLRWGAIGDMFYSYLLLVPLALFVHRRLRANRPWLADLGVVAGLAYIFLGGAGAAILATVGSTLVEAYSSAAASDQAAIAVAFEALRNVVFLGLWQMIDAITLGTWIASTGVLLLAQRRRLGRLLVVLGGILYAASVMTMLGIHSAVLLAGGLVVALAAWVAWLLIDRR